MPRELASDAGGSSARYVNGVATMVTKSTTDIETRDAMEAPRRTSVGVFKAQNLHARRCDRDLVEDVRAI